MPSDSKRPCWEIYNEEMSPLNKGHALWQPAPLPYFERVQLGDVGYIREGCFNLLFSARCPPSPLKKLDIGRILQPQPQIPGCLTGNQEATVITKPSSGTPVSTLEPGSSIQLQFKERRGAALVTKCQTYKETIQAVGTFNKYVKENYASWVEFAREEGHGDVNPVLVTGLDRTKDFAMMCYSNHDNGLECEFKTSTSEVASGSAWGTWQTTKFIHMNHGPQMCSPPSSANAEDLRPPGGHPAETASDGYNQCVFVRYFTMRTRRLGIPKVIKAGAGPHDPRTGWEHDDEGLLPEVHSGLGWDSGSDSDSESDMSSLLDSDVDDDGGSVTSIETESDMVIHNPTSDNKDDFDVIADYIFQNSDAESALLHHQDITLLREPGSSVDLMTQLLEKRLRIVVDENGVGMIAPQTEISTEKPPDPLVEPPQAVHNLDTGSYCSWFLPWLTLTLQIPFAVGYLFEELLNFFMVIGSPALVVYSLQITHLNASWIKKATSNLKYPSSRAIAAVMSAFPETGGRSTPLVIGFSLVVLSAFLESVDRLYRPPSDGIRCSTVAFWTFLLPLVVGFLHASSKRVDNLKECLENGDTLARIGTDHEDRPIRTSDTTVPKIWAVGSMRVDEADLPRIYEPGTPLVFNYARVFTWSQQANQILSLLKTASTSGRLLIPPDGDDPGEDAWCVTSNNWSIGDKNQLGLEESRWAPGIWWRVRSAMVFALGLQWGAIGVAVAVNYLMPPVGLDYRTLSFLAYGATATLSLLFCVASSVLAHISRLQNNLAPRPPWLQACLNGGAAVCNCFGKTLAFIAGMWIIAIYFFQVSGCTSIVSVLLGLWTEGLMTWWCLGLIL